MISPRQHQAEAMWFHRNNPRLGTLLWHGMGLGKTLSSLWLAREKMAELRAAGVKAPKFMVILPKSAIPTWRVECFNNCRDIFNDMKLLPYSQLHKAPQMLSAIDVRMLVFDEVHAIKSPETLRIQQLSAFLKALAASPGTFGGGRILALTGTTAPNNAAEYYVYWALCTAPDLHTAAERILDIKRYEEWRSLFTNHSQVAWTVGKPNPRTGKKALGGIANKWEGVANEDRLAQLISPFVHFKRVSECIDLPEKQEIYVDLGMADDKLLHDANIERPDAYMAVVERLSRAKIPYLQKWVTDFITENTAQLVVFSNHTKPLRELRDRFPNDIRLITGDESTGERTRNLKDFQEGKYRVLAMSYKCGSESLNLQNCQYAVYHGWPWTDAAIKQAMARIYRSGQKQKTFHYFLTSGENDMNALRRIRAKEEATTKVENLLLERENSPVTPSLDSFI